MMASKIVHAPPVGKPVNRRQATPVATAAKLHQLCTSRPTLALVLGSGFHMVADATEVRTVIPYAKLPGFPPTGVAGHAGKVLVGKLGGTEVIILSGRAHYYEGHSMAQVTFAVRTLAAAEVSDLILTNAAGGINKRFIPGDLMLVTDHINLMGMNALRETRPVARLPRSRADTGNLFVDLSCAYDPTLRNCLMNAAKACRIRLRSGVYLAVSGPSYETPAEIRAFARLGADAVGMSTVPEAIVARQCGLRVAALSCITNLAAGRSAEPLSHAEVLATAERSGVTATKLLATFARFYAHD